VCTTKRIRKKGKKEMKKIMMFAILSLAITASVFSAGAVEVKSNSTIQVYAGAGMSKPVKKLVEKFESEMDVDVNLTLANLGQIISQINTSKMGDVFICASKEDLKKIESSVSKVESLAKHEIAFAVAKGNPKNIKSIDDLTRDDVTLVIGNSSTVAGKTADKMLRDGGLIEDVNIIARQTTAAMIYTVLQRDECDAIITWKNNTGEDCTILDQELTDKYTKTISAASLIYTEDTDAQSLFIEFLKSDEAAKIWESEGYERI
jgi:molybdate transport system substrate-binding protein